SVEVHEVAVQVVDNFTHPMSRATVRSGFWPPEPRVRWVASEKYLPAAEKRFDVVQMPRHERQDARGQIMLAAVPFERRSQGGVPIAHAILLASSGQTASSASGSQSSVSREKRGWSPA